jgi:PAS domain-containing protein
MRATFAGEQTGRASRFLLCIMSASSGPTDFRLVLHDHLSDSYELSRVLLATADFDGKLQLLTSAWEEMLGYEREALKGKTLSQLMWCNAPRAAAAVAAILDANDMGAVELRLRCCNDQGKCLTLHRLYDKEEMMMYIVAVEGPAKRGILPRRDERRVIARQA